ncbi:MAG: response regulator transcription factor [Actinomycetales bacterium]|nr:response regulator transcription factor [Actinomycetales bacterium]
MSAGIDVVGEATHRDEAVAVVAGTSPDVAILDIRIPPGHLDDGLVAAERIRRDDPDVGLLVLSHYLESSYAERLLTFADAGVGYLVKDRVQDGDVLVDTLYRIAAREVVIDTDLVRQVIRRRRRHDPLERLTTQERQVLALMAEGYSNTAIGRRAFCSVKTVERRVTAISEKLGLPSGEDGGRSEVNIRVLAVLTYLRSLPA